MTEKEIKYLNEKFVGKQIMVKFIHSDKEHYWYNKFITVTIKQIGVNLTFKSRKPSRFETLVVNKNFPQIESINTWWCDPKNKEDAEKILDPLLNCTFKKIDYLNNLIEYKLTQGKK